MLNERDLAHAWYGRVVWVQHGHYVAALHFNRRHWFIGTFTVVLAAAVGTSVFATLAKQADLLVLTGALSVVATLASALQTFLSYGERADKHRVAGARYGVVGRELELLLARSEFNSEALAKVKERLDALAQECPHIPDAVHKRMERERPEGLPFAREQG
ncbi:MAG: SLATT domain-containing protein [Nitrososphaera sp.]|nr:SLATT domain-containing protein [Nitrososphaera sp.]